MELYGIVKYWPIVENVLLKNAHRELLHQTRRVKRGC